MSPVPCCWPQDGCVGSAAWLRHGEDGALSAGARRSRCRQMLSRAPRGACYPVVFPGGEITAAQHGAAGRAQNSQHSLSPASTEPSFLSFRTQVLPCTRRKPWSSRLTTRGARSDSRRRMRTAAPSSTGALPTEAPHLHTPWADSLQEGAEGERCSLGRGISICTRSLASLPPAGLTTGP